jgi:hypothetical protein
MATVRRSKPAVAEPPAKAIVLDYHGADPKRSAVRFSASNGKKDAVPALYVMRAAWEALGRPESVRLTLEPLS